jgi:hypothetical protein
MERKTNYAVLFFYMLFLGVNLLFASDPIGDFKTTFWEQVQSYIIPIILIVTIIASGITYMKTKDWTISLVVGAIVAAIVGGAPSLAEKFASFNIGS